jgi:hypothetical protein
LGDRRRRADGLVLAGRQGVGIFGDPHIGEHRLCLVLAQDAVGLGQTLRYAIGYDE